MRRIDTTTWGKFVIGDLMTKLDLKIKKEDFDKRIDTSLERTEEFSLPLINAKDGNNGIMYYGREEDFENDEMCLDIIQNGAVATGNVYAQIEKTGVLWDAYLVKPKNSISKYALLFLSCIVEKSIKQKYSYDNKAIWEKVKHEVISLPQDEQGNPDWKYMECMMQQMENRVNNNVTLISRVLEYIYRKKIDTRKWGRFHLYDESLFTIDSGTKLDKIKMTNKNPSINFVGRANANNGVTDHIDRIEGLKPYDAGCLTISLGGEYLGSCFIQEKPFYTSQNVNVLIPKHPMSEYCKRFISTMIFREGRLHYKAFVDELNRHMKTDFTILLPVTSDNKPDWDYMEKYMQIIEQKTKNVLKQLAN
jgi:hypothetical protein